MSRRSKDRYQPELHCVWMTAGLISWKLCDRQFECEECLLDRALRGSTIAREDVPAAEQDRAAVARFPEDRRYHGGHTWARRSGETRIRVGVDAFAAHLVQCVRSAILLPEGTPVTRNRPGCWLVCAQMPVPILAPVTGRVIEVNEAVRERPWLVAESPYEEGWLYEVASHDPHAALDALVDGPTIERRARLARQRIEDEVEQFTQRGRDLVGATAADGGTPAIDPRKVLGLVRYTRIVARVLTNHDEDEGQP